MQANPEELINNLGTIVARSTHMMMFAVFRLRLVCCRAGCFEAVVALLLLPQSVSRPSLAPKPSWRPGLATVSLSVSGRDVAELHVEEHAAWSV